MARHKKVQWTDQPSHQSSNISGSVVWSQHLLMGISKSLIAVFLMQSTRFRRIQLFITSSRIPQRLSTSKLGHRLWLASNKIANKSPMVFIVHWTSTMVAAPNKGASLFLTTSSCPHFHHQVVLYMRNGESAKHTLIWFHEIVVKVGGNKTGSIKQITWHRILLRG